jgi:alpha-1,2-mannosyltransferase
VTRRGSLAIAALSVVGYLAWAGFGSADMWWLGDLRVYRNGGLDVLAGDGALYTIRPGRLPFTYTPWAGVLFTPLAWLPWGAVEVLGVAANLGLLAVASWLAWGLAGLRGDRVRASALTTAVLLWTEPVQETLRFGQINLLLLVLVLADLSRARGSRGGWFAGVGVGIAAGLKLTPAIFIAYLLLTGRVREGLTALGVFIGTFAVAFAVLPGESLEYWGGLFLDDTRIGLAQFPGNQSLHGAVTRQFGADAPPGWLWPVLAVPAASIGLALAVAVARRGAALAGIGLCALTALLVSPISWTHHWVWALPLVVALADRVRRIGGGADVGAWRAGLWLVAVLALGAAYPMHRARISGLLPGGIVWTAPFGDGRELRLQGWELIAGSAYVIAGVGVLIAYAWSLRPFMAFGRTRRTGDMTLS